MLCRFVVTLNVQFVWLFERKKVLHFHRIVFGLIIVLLYKENHQDWSERNRTHDRVMTGEKA